MRLLLDEMLSPEIAAQLRSKGHDVEALKGHPEWEGLKDPDVMDLARRERRAVVTNNVVDFRPLHAAALGPGGEGDYGIVFMVGNYRRTKADSGKIVLALEASLGASPDERSLVDAEVWL